MWDGEGMAIGCNCADDVNILCVTDKWLVYKIMDGSLRPKKPLLLGPSAWKEARNANVWNKVRVAGVVTHAEGLTLNAGQAATLWALHLGFDEISLYGFDSLWTGERTSKTDEAWAKWKSGKPARTDGFRPAPQKWAGGWKGIHGKYPEKVLAVHAPAGVEINTFGGLFRLVEH